MKIDLKSIYKESPKTLQQMYKTYEYTIKDNYFIQEVVQHKPLDNQITFLTYPTEEMLYGGMAGGGKTDALLMAALQYVEEKHIPENENKLTYDALIIRRTLDDLEMPNAILDRAKSWLLPLENTGLVIYKDLKKQFRFSSGATITFRYLSHNNDLNKYQGAELQYIAFDELTQFPENQYNYLHSRLRKTEDNTIPLRMRTGSNPGGRGHEWVKQKFIIGDVPFVPASYIENIHLNQEEYTKQLEKLDELTKRQLMYGDWDAELSEGLLCNREQLKAAKINKNDFKDWIPVFNVIGIDKASTGSDEFALASLTLFNNGKIVLTGLDGTTSSYPEELTRTFIKEQYTHFKTYIVNFEREPGSDFHYAGKYWQDELHELIQDYGIIVKQTPDSNSKFNRARPHAKMIREGKLLFDDSLDLNSLFNQYIYTHPEQSVMKDFPSPDRLDAVSFAFMELIKFAGAGIIED